MWWRSIVLAIVGGAAIAVVTVVPIALFDDETDFSDVGMAAYFAALIGLVLGVIVGLVLGLVAAFSLTPYRGSHRTLMVVRVLASVLVGVGLGLLFLGAAIEWFTVALVCLGVVGAWFTSPFAVTWYIRRMNAAR